jgi:hypothetical protein
MAIFQQSKSPNPRKSLAYNSFREKKGAIVMKRFVWVLVSAISILGAGELSAQSKPSRLLAEFSGASLKWVHAAEPEFQRRNLNLDKYIVSITEEDDSVVVTLSATDAVKGAFGSSGSYPGYEVEIRKKDMKVVRSNYVR